MRAIRRAMCQLRLEKCIARRLNFIDQKSAFGIGYGNSIRVIGDRAPFPTRRSDQ